MANDFKRFCTPNVSDSSNSTIYAVPAGASSAALESIVIGITMANKTSSGITAVSYTHLTLPTKRIV